MITWEELLAKIDKPLNKVFANHQEVKDLQAAVRVVVELHKPQEITLPNGEWGANCVQCDGYFYPCPTIQAIERELR